jgi:hypothetical protein
MVVVTPLNNFLGPEGDTVTVDEQLLNTEYRDRRRMVKYEKKRSARRSTPRHPITMASTAEPPDPMPCALAAISLPESSPPCHDADACRHCAGESVGIWVTWCLRAVRGRACVGAWAGEASCGSFGAFEPVAIWSKTLLTGGRVLCGKVPNKAQMR